MLLLSRTIPGCCFSLYWGDPDYTDNVFEVLRELVGPQFENLERVADFVDVQNWLRENDVRLYTEVCDARMPG